MKKVLVAALLCTVSTFAAWDKFPVIEDGKGEAKFEYIAVRQGHDGMRGQDFGLYGIRFSPLANLELAAYPGYTLGARYQVIPILSAGVDVGFPLPGTRWAFTPNVQFSMPITGAITLGSNVDLAVYTEDAASKYSEGMDLSAGLELDLAINEKNTVWVSFDIQKKLTESERDINGQKYKAEDNKGMVLAPALGYLITLGNLDLGTFVGFLFGGEDVGLDPFATAVGIDASVKF